MASLTYLIPRIIRHCMPPALVRLLLERRWIIRPGYETSDPLTAVQRYQLALEQYQASLTGKRVMIFGYGGNYAVACHLLQLGASHVVLVEQAGFPESRANEALLPAFPQYVEAAGKSVRPRPEYMTVLHQDIHAIARQRAVEPVDIVLTSSVYEHLPQVESITAALAQLTAPDGVHVHFIDLRDHYFRYPFEMLTFSETVWRRWLNPTSNHNRCRYEQYQQVFRDHFARVAVTPIASDPAAFAIARPRILPQFLSGDDALDAVTEIQVFAAVPLP